MLHVYYIGPQPLPRPGLELATTETHSLINERPALFTRPYAMAVEYINNFHNDKNCIITKKGKKKKDIYINYMECGWVGACASVIVFLFFVPVFQS